MRWLVVPLEVVDLRAAERSYAMYWLYLSLQYKGGLPVYTCRPERHMHKNLVCVCVCVCVYGVCACACMCVWVYIGLDVISWEVVQILMAVYWLWSCKPSLLHQEEEKLLNRWYIMERANAGWMIESELLRIIMFLVSLIGSCICWRGI